MMPERLSAVLRERTEVFLKMIVKLHCMFFMYQELF